MKYGTFIIVGIIAIVLLMYDPKIQSLAGTITAIENDAISITCNPPPPKFKPSEDIQKNCTILINEATILPAEPLIVGQQAAVELTHKMHAQSTEQFVAKEIKITK